MRNNKGAQGEGSRDRAARTGAFEGRSFSRRLTPLRNRQIAQIRKTPALEFVSQHRYATRALRHRRTVPRADRHTKGYCTDLFLSPFFFPLLSRKACRGSNRPRECLRALARIAAPRRDSDFKERVTHMRVIYCRIKVERGMPGSYGMLQLKRPTS